LAAKPVTLRHSELDFLLISAMIEAPDQLGEEPLPLYAEF
jgi:hypothetical protein